MTNNYETSINVIIKNRSDTSDNWSKSNRVLEEGEFGYDTTNKKFKIGDGQTAWNDLSYSPNIIDLSSYVPREDWITNDEADDNYYGGFENMKELAKYTYMILWSPLNQLMHPDYSWYGSLGIGELAMDVADMISIGTINGGSALTKDSEWNKYISV